MPAALLWGLTVFCFVSSITPGPNNLMLMSSGVNFGVRRTLPHMTGVALGFVLMVALVGLGLAGLFSRYPALLVAMKWIGAAYMVWLAVKLARATPIKAGEAKGRPITFVQAAAFQWINPKAWIMALTAVATYSDPADYTRTVLMVALVFGMTTLPCVATWVFFGTALRHALQRPAILRAFNWTMGFLLIASLYPVFTE
ncbi:MAG: LysE family translocator [Janthinobacterium lividum]